VPAFQPAPLAQLLSRQRRLARLGRSSSADLCAGTLRQRGTSKALVGSTVTLRMAGWTRFLPGRFPLDQPGQYADVRSLLRGGSRHLTPVVFLLSIQQAAS